MTPADCDTFKDLFKLTKLFCDFIAWMEGRIKTRLYEALYEILPSIYKLIKEYKRHSAYYTALAMGNQYIKSNEDGTDIEVNYILIFITNILGKLHKY